MVVPYKNAALQSYLLFNTQIVFIKVFNLIKKPSR